MIIFCSEFAMGMCHVRQTACLILRAAQPTERWKPGNVHHCPIDHDLKMFDLKHDRNATMTVGAPVGSASNKLAAACSNFRSVTTGFW